LGVQTVPAALGFRVTEFPVLVSVAVTDAWLFAFVTSGLNVTFAVGWTVQVWFPVKVAKY
jgi:hypothetical protein